MIEKRDLQAILPMGLSAFFLLAGYAFFRPAMNSLYKEVYGAENLNIVMGFGVLGVMVAVWLYARLLSWGGPRTTLAVSVLVSAILILIHYFGLKNGIKEFAFSGYLLKEAYIVLIIEQYWSFLNSKISSSNAKKLFGLVLGVSSIGSIVGSQLSAHIVVELGSEAMLIAAAFATGVAGFFSDQAFRLVGEPNYEVEVERHVKDPLALGLFKTNKTLIYIFLVILLTQIFSAVTELRFHHILQNTLSVTELQNKYENEFWSWVESSGLLLNFLIAPVLLRFVSLRWIHFLFPLIHLASAIMVLVHPTLVTVTFSYLWFKSFDYSLFRAAKEILYIPFSYAARYRAKEVIDVFGYRAGKGGISLATSAVQSGVVGTLNSAYSWIAVSAAAVWLFLVPGLTKNRRE